VFAFGKNRESEMKVGDGGVNSSKPREQFKNYNKLPIFNSFSLQNPEYNTCKLMKKKRNNAFYWLYPVSQSSGGIFFPVI